MLRDHRQYGEQPQRDRGVARGRGDGEFGRGDGLRDGGPRADGGRAVGAVAGLGEVEDARGRGREEDEEADVEENGDDGAAELRDELVARLRAQEVARLQVARHVRRLRGGPGGDHARGEVHDLRGVLREVRALADAAEDELGRLRDGGDGVDVGRPGGLHADEGEEEAEDEREERLADVHREHLREDRAAHDDGEDEAGHPPECRHAVRARGQVLVVVGVVVRVLAEP